MLNKEGVTVKVFLFLLLVFSSCSSKDIKNTVAPIKPSALYQYKTQETIALMSHYYWYKFPSVTLCGFYIMDKKSKKIMYHVSDYESCPYEIEDGFSIETGSITKEFREKYKKRIDLAEKTYYKTMIKHSFKKDDVSVASDNILNRLNIVFLEVTNVALGDQLNIRESPHHKSKIQTKVDNKSIKLFTLIESMKNKSNGSWLRVYYFDENTYAYKHGWVNRSYIRTLGK